jgi:hypothetical protein
MAYMRGLCVIAVVFSLVASASLPGIAGERRFCVPERPIPPESLGPTPIPFDVPVWPTLLKTEFHILPWVSLGKASVCLPGTCWALEFPAPCFSLKPIPVWIPWLRPLDLECQGPKPCP